MAKTFDCVEMKHKGAERVQQEIAGMTMAEELAYWARGTQELRAIQRSQRKVSLGSGKDLQG